MHCTSLYLCQSVLSQHNVLLKQARTWFSLASINHWQLHATLLLLLLLLSTHHLLTAVKAEHSSASVNINITNSNSISSSSSSANALAESSTGAQSISTVTELTVTEPVWW
jgi:hypothetical protein